MGKVFAIIALRMRLRVRRMRGSTRIINMISGVLLAVAGLLLTLALAIGFGMMIHKLVGDGNRTSLLTGYMVFFYACAFFGIVLPLLRGAMNEGFDAAPFRVFPIGRRQLFGITVAAAFGSSEHLLYVPALASVALMGVLLPGVNAAAGLTLIVLALIFNGLWSHLLTLMLATIMRGRRTKEILAFAGATLILVFSLLMVVINHAAGGPEEWTGSFEISVRPLLSLGSPLGPSLAATGLTALHDSDGGMRTALGSILGLFAWNVTALALGYYVFSRYHVGDRSRPRKREKPVERVESSRSLFSFDRGPLAMLPSVVQAVAAKDLRYLLRSVVGRFSLFIAPLPVLIVTMVLEEHLDEPIFGIDPRRLLLFGLLFHAVTFTNNFVNNAFAWEGSGIGTYYTSPASLKRVLMGKNLAAWLFNGMLFVLIMATWSIIMGIPDPLTLVTSLLLFAAAHLFFASWGNVVSVLFPLPRNPSSLSNSPSQAAVLLSILGFAVMLILIGPFLSIPTLLGMIWLQPVGLIVLLVALTGAYVFSLGLAGRLLAERKDRLIETLKAPR